MADYEYFAFVVNMEGTGQDPRLTYNSADPETETPDLNIWEHRASLQPNVTPLAIGNNLYGLLILSPCRLTIPCWARQWRAGC